MARPWYANPKWRASPRGCGTGCDTTARLARRWNAARWNAFGRATWRRAPPRRSRARSQPPQPHAPSLELAPVERGLDVDDAAPRLKLREELIERERKE